MPYLAVFSNRLKQTVARFVLFRIAKVSACTLLFSITSGLLVGPDEVIAHNAVHTMAHTTAHTKGASCSGTGQIISGEGRGGIVSLALSKRHEGGGAYSIQLRDDYFNGDSFRIRRGAVTSRPYGSWIAEEINSNEVFLTLQHSRPYLVVSYSLSC